MAKNYSGILKAVVKKIEPSVKEKKILNAYAKKAVAYVKKEAKKFNAKVILAGSITRDTWLTDKREFDVFVMFPEKTSEKRMEEIGLKIGKTVIQKMKGVFTIEYAEHPYVSGTVEGIDIDIVPCFEIKTTEKLKSAVDRTPFHVRYIEKNLPLKLSDQVRILKQFLKTQEMYGADAKTEGFSGYVCELLIIKYKNFLNVLKQVETWRPGEIIDIESFYSKDEHQKLKRMFKGQLLILIDPTDKKRNTAAALSQSNFFKFKKLANEFLKNPSKQFFFEPEVEPITESQLISYQLQRRTELIIVKFAPPNVVADILWPQMRRFGERLQDILEEVKYEFKVFGRDVYTNEKDFAAVLFEMEISKLPSVQKKIGPSVFDFNDSKRFLDKYKGQTLAGPFVEDGKWVVIVSRRFLTAREKLFDSLKVNASILKAKGIPNHIADKISQGFEIISENDKIMELAKKDKVFGIFLRKYFEKEGVA